MPSPATPVLTPVALADAPRRLAALLRATPREEPVAFSPIPPGDPARTTAAVDGSSATLLDAASFHVAAYRAAAILAPASGRPIPLTGVSRIAVLHEGDATEQVQRALDALGHPAEIPRRLTPDAALDALRGLEEIAMARAALAHLDAGDLLLLDGAIQCRPPTLPQALVEAFLDEAHTRGVQVAGVCKSTSMTLAGQPALAHLRRRAYAECPHPTWCAPLPRTSRTLLAHPWAARLNPAQRAVFRVDVSPRVEDPLALLSRVAAASNHPGYPGYPYPLALAHNAAALDERTQEDLRAQVERAARAAGVDEEAWEAAFHDYHDDLERGI